MKKINILVFVFLIFQTLSGQEYVKTEVKDAYFTTSFYDSTGNCLYAGGNVLMKFSGTSWSYFPKPELAINSITKYKNELYVAGNGVFRYDGTKWININSPYTERISDMFIYNNELYFFTGYLQDSLFVWNGTTWNKIDPGVSDINCRGVSMMYYYNNELYANSSGKDNYAAVIIKKTNDKWSFPNGIHFNLIGDHSCIFNDNLYITNGDRLHVYNGVKWETPGFAFHYGEYGSDYITSIRSNDKGLFVCGKIDIVHSVNWKNVDDFKGSMRANNLVMLCSNGNASNLDVGLDLVSDVNFLNNKIYAFGGNYFSILDNTIQVPIPQISITDTVLCEFEPLKISEQSNSGIKWLWQIDDFKTFDKQIVDLYNLEPGVYSPKLTVSNCAGNTTFSFDSLITIHEKPVTPVIDIKGDTLYSSSQYNNKWFFWNGVLIDTTNSIVIRDSIANSSIYVAVTNELGCTSQSSWIYTGINNFKVQNNVSIIPNPNNGIFKLELGTDFIINNKQFQIEILDINGKTIRNLEISNALDKFINLSFLKKGIYFIKIFNKSEFMVKKMIIK